MSAPCEHRKRQKEGGSGSRYEWTLERANEDAQRAALGECSPEPGQREDLNNIHKRLGPCLRKQYRKVLARERKLKVEMSDRVGRRQAAKSRSISPEEQQS